METYIDVRQKYTELVTKTIQRKNEERSLIDILENGQGHCDVHMLREDQDPRDRAEVRFQVATYFYNASSQSKAINTLLEQNIEGIVDWIFKSTDKKKEFTIEFDKPIGYGVDLDLNKYDIKKARVVLTRDEDRDLKFNLTTLMPYLDNSAQFVTKLERRHRPPRLLQFFKELTSQKNRPYYNATMFDNKLGTRIQVTNAITHQKYTIALRHDSNLPIFTLDDRQDHFNCPMQESEFRKKEAAIMEIFDRHSEWKKEKPPVEHPVVKEQKEKRLTRLEEYCLTNNVSYKSFETLDANRFKFAKILLIHELDPCLAIRSDITNDMLQTIIRQAERNCDAGKVLPNGQIYSRVDIMHYVNEECLYTNDQLKKLFFYASLGINTTFMENPELSPEQMDIIKKAVNYAANHPNQKLDIEKIANPEYSIKEMEIKLDEEIKKAKQFGGTQRNDFWQNR